MAIAISISRGNPGLLLNSISTLIGDALRSVPSKEEFIVRMPLSMADIAKRVLPVPPQSTIGLGSPTQQTSVSAISVPTTSVVWGVPVEWSIDVTWE